MACLTVIFPSVTGLHRQRYSFSTDWTPPSWRGMTLFAWVFYPLTILGKSVRWHQLIAAPALSPSRRCRRSGLLQASRQLIAAHVLVPSRSGLPTVSRQLIAAHALVLSRRSRPSRGDHQLIAVRALCRRPRRLTVSCLNRPAGRTGRRLVETRLAEADSHAVRHRCRRPGRGKRSLSHGQRRSR